MRKTLVTGCAGFIGSHLCEALLDKGFEVTGIDNFDPFYDKSYKLSNLITARKNSHFVFYEEDLLNYDRIASIFKGHDVVIHLAGKAGVRPSILDPQAYIDNNISATRNVLDAMREAGIFKLLFASSSSIYGNNPHTPWHESLDVNNPISPYAFSKKGCELLNHTYHHLYGIDILNLRFFTVFGPRQRPDLAIHKFFKKFYRDEPISMYGDGDSARDYTFVSDTVQGILGALDYVLYKENVFDVVNLGHHHPVKLIDLINAIGEVVGKKPRIDQLPMQPGDVDITYADISRAKELFDYHPVVTLKEGLQAFEKWFFSNPDFLK
ncbi:NAD-dependent epimerase/dehydratase family protein [Marinilabiliaceae bacterium JC017]|nr:NAD-dependent epimerase/dehydratase family protein [Marinilabiliaceae bacterium JC017]